MRHHNNFSYIHIYFKIEVTVADCSEWNSKNNNHKTRHYKETVCHESGDVSFFGRNLKQKQPESKTVSRNGLYLAPLIVSIGAKATMLLVDKMNENE